MQVRWTGTGARVAALVFAMTIGGVPLAPTQARAPGDACALRLGPAAGPHMEPSRTVRRVIAVEPLGQGRFRPQCGPVTRQRASLLRWLRAAAIPVVAMSKISKPISARGPIRRVPTRSDPGSLSGFAPPG